jgi:hypothetical protein
MICTAETIATPRRTPPSPPSRRPEASRRRLFSPRRHGEHGERRASGGTATATAFTAKYAKYAKDAKDGDGGLRVKGYVAFRDVRGGLGVLGVERGAPWTATATAFTAKYAKDGDDGLRVKGYVTLRDVRFAISRLAARRGRGERRGPCGRSGRPEGEPRRPPRRAHRPRGRQSRRRALLWYSLRAGEESTKLQQSPPSALLHIPL